MKCSFSSNISDFIYQELWHTDVVGHVPAPFLRGLCCSSRKEMKSIFSSSFDFDLLWPRKCSVDSRAWSLSDLAPLAFALLKPRSCHAVKGLSYWRMSARPEERSKAPSWQLAPSARHVREVILVPPAAFEPWGGLRVMPGEISKKNHPDCHPTESWGSIDLCCFKPLCVGDGLLCITVKHSWDLTFCVYLEVHVARRIRLYETQ